jgi:trk system potassium uptake protein TrkH
VRTGDSSGTVRVNSRKVCHINKLSIKNNSPFKALLRNPPLLMTVLYLAVVALGTALLSLPIATATGECASFMEALFTATTALCVTGLVTVTTATYWSLFGKIVILLLIQLGGLGIVTAAAGLAMTLNMRITMRSRLAIAAEKNAETPRGMARLIHFVLVATFAIELFGAAVLATRFVPAFGWKTGMWYAVFHSVSAYCNAGLDILGANSLEMWASDIVVILAISMLIILGGIGYPVYRDIIKGRRWKKFRLHTKIVVATTAVLLIGGTILFWVLERKNPATMGNQLCGIQWLNAFLQSTTTRTAGFSSIPQGSLTHASALLAITLMFIGGALSSVTAGILADVLQLPVETVPEPQNVGAVGAAMVVAAGLGRIGDLAAAEELIRPDAVYQPNPSSRAVHDRNYDTFIQLYAANKHLFRHLNQDI